jgi:hypothetical protein
MRLALLLAAVLALSVSAQEPLSVAVLREDGYLVPMVTVRGDEYAPLTTFDDIHNKSSFTRQAAELTGEWRWWRVGGSEAPPLTTIQRAFVHNHCSTEEAWQTTVKGKQVEPSVADIGKIGIAVRNGEVVAPEDLTGRPDQASRKFVPLIVSLAHSREAERLRTETTNPIHEFDRATRAARAVVIEKLIRHQDTGLVVYYFEAVKKYGHIRAFTTGWLVETGGAVQPRDVKFQMDDDGYKENERAYALGIIPYAGKQLWVLRVHHYESESHAIREWPSGRLVGDLGGGGC